MNRAAQLLILTLVLSYSSAAHSQVSLQIKIAQIVGTKTVETIRTISANYDQDIVVSQDGLKNKIVFNLRKFKDILVNGNKINPVQIDMKVVNETKKMIGKSQTVTSFYNKSAQFKSGDMDVSVKFEDI